MIQTGSRGKFLPRVSGNPEFSARHRIAPVTETFANNDVKAAIDRLLVGKKGHRLVLKNG